MKISSKSIGGILAAASAILFSVSIGLCDSSAKFAANSLGVVGMEDCALCHEKQVKSMTDGAMHANVHFRNGIGKCTDCHDPAKLKESHADVKPGKTRFVKARRYSQDFCLNCHGNNGELAKRTAKSKIFTDITGHTVNPHDVPKNAAHEKLVECSNCHKEHKKNPEVKTYCQSCHHTGEFITCIKCHSQGKGK